MEEHSLAAKTHKSAMEELLLAARDREIASNANRIKNLNVQNKNVTATPHRKVFNTVIKNIIPSNATTELSKVIGRRVNQRSNATTTASTIAHRRPNHSKSRR